MARRFLTGAKVYYILDCVQTGPATNPDGFSVFIKYKEYFLTQWLLASKGLYLLHMVSFSYDIIQIICIADKRSIRPTYSRIRL